MRRPSLVFLSVALLPFAANAAEITRIASSFEDNKPFGFFLDVGFERTQQRGKIVREWHQGDTTEDVSELRYTMIDSRLKIDAHIGLWKDFEFHYGIPVVFQQDRTWNYAGGTDDTNSTIQHNCVRADGSITDPNCPVSGGTVGNQPMFAVPANSYRGGVGDMTFGLAYAFFNQHKDDTKPMWIVGFDYTAPTSDLNDPTVPTDNVNKGKLGDKMHQYKWYTSLSKRIGIADPYFQVWYTLGYWGPGWYSNCDHPDPNNMGAVANCGTDAWSRRDTGLKPAHHGGVLFGSEFNAYDEPSKHQKVAIDIRGVATYVSEGRYFNEMSDLFHKYLYTGEYLEVGGHFGFIAHAAEYVSLAATADWLYRTEYTLTDESIGKDLDGNGTVDITTNPKEVNPNFDWRSDMVSRRFRMAETNIFRLNITATVNF